MVVGIEMALSSRGMGAEEEASFKAGSFFSHRDRSKTCLFLPTRGSTSSLTSAGKSTEKTPPPSPMSSLSISVSMRSMKSKFFGSFGSILLVFSHSLSWALFFLIVCLNSRDLDMVSVMYCGGLGAIFCARGLTEASTRAPPSKSSLSANRRSILFAHLQWTKMSPPMYMVSPPMVAQFGEKGTVAAKS